MLAVCAKTSNTFSPTKDVVVKPTRVPDVGGTALVKADHNLLDPYVSRSCESSGKDEACWELVTGFDVSLGWRRSGTCLC